MCGICAHRTDTIHNTVLVMNRYCSQTFSRFLMAKTSKLNPSKVSNVNTPADCNRTLCRQVNDGFFMQIDFSNHSGRLYHTFVFLLVTLILFTISTYVTNCNAH